MEIKKQAPINNTVLLGTLKTGNVFRFDDNDEENLFMVVDTDSIENELEISIEDGKTTVITIDIEDGKISTCNK